MATILIADDVASETALIARVVQELGHSSLTVSDGAACIEHAEKYVPDLILLDVVMPGMDGFNTCRKLKKSPATAGIPIVMVTSKNGESDQFWAKRQGADGYLTKPFKPEALAAQIQQFVKAAS